MLFQKACEKIKASFPHLVSSVNAEDKSITIPSNSNEVGSIVIVDHSSEMTLYVGDFTHWHARCYEDQLSVEEKEESIVSEVIDFLEDMFGEKIIMWGSNEDGGGFYYRDLDPEGQDAPPDPEGTKQYVWSGKTIN